MMENYALYFICELSIGLTCISSEDDDDSTDGKLDSRNSTRTTFGINMQFNSLNRSSLCSSFTWKISFLSISFECWWSDYSLCVIAQLSPDARKMMSNQFNTDEWFGSAFSVRQILYFAYCVCVTKIRSNVDSIQLPSGSVSWHSIWYLWIASEWMAGSLTRCLLAFRDQFIL